MGTRGFRIIRHRGRYYVYYNHFDSYPEGLGQVIVDAIPLDPQKYQLWLAAQREKRDQISVELEDTVLTVPSDTGKDGDAVASGDEAKIEKRDNEIFAYGVAEASDEEDDSDDNEEIEAKNDEDQDKGNPNRPNGPDALEKHKNIVKRFVSFQDLEDMPSPICVMGLDLFIEWTYTIDLDRELFSVNMNTHFKMDNISRDKWIDGVTAEAHDVDDNKERTIRTCPEATRRLPLPAYFNNDEEAKVYAAKYASYKSSSVGVKREQLSVSPSPIAILAAVTLEKFISAFKVQFITYVLGWNHEDFAFRELAFAVLCFATGEYHLESPNRLTGNADIGYLHYSKSEDTTTQGDSKFLPVFPIGSHHPGQEPGSAPSAGIFWFHGVLVSLVPDHILQDKSLAEAAVAKVVEFGLAQGKTSFNALVFSILNTIMINVSTEDTQDGDATKQKSVIVKHTSTTPIIPAITLRRGRRNPAPEPQFSELFEGFLSFAAFFDAATHQDLSCYGQGRLPIEIFAKILAEAPDFYTYSRCSVVSKTFLELSHKNRFLGKDLTVTKCTISKKGHPSFTLKDRKTGQIITFSDERGKEVEVWHPIIGVDKPSIIRHVSFGLKATG